MTALQKIIKGAKSLQKKNKNLSWKDAVKKSSKIYNASKKTTAKKTVKKKTISKKIAAVKKVPVKKSLSHKDTKSHNVNIRVMSGNGNLPALERSEIMQKLQTELKHLDFAEKQISMLKKILERQKISKVKFEGFQLLNIRNTAKHYKETSKIHKANIRTYKKLLK